MNREIALLKKKNTEISASNANDPIIKKIAKIYSLFVDFYDSIPNHNNFNIQGSQNK